MSDLGNLLKKARMDRGISIDDLQEITKIRKRYLEAIEEGNFQVLPGNFYARAFIKSYAEAVGLNVDEVLHLFSSEIPAVHLETHTEHAHRPRRRAVNSEAWSKWASFAIAVAFPILIIGIIYYFFFYNAEPGRQVEKETPLTNKSETLSGTPTPLPTFTPAPTPVPTPEQAELKLVKTDEATNTEYYEVAGDKLDIVLQLTGEECWVGLKKNDKNGENVQQVRMQKGATELLEWSLAGTAFYLNIGRANSVAVTINGVEFDMGTNPNPKRFQLSLQP